MEKLAFPILILSFLSCADTTLPEVGPHFEMVELRHGVHAALAIDGRRAGSNSGIVFMGGGNVVIFDTSLTPEVGTLFRAFAESLYTVTRFIVVNSNFESEHVRGNQVFADDATIFGTTALQQGLSETEPMRLQLEKTQVPEQLPEVRAALRSAVHEREKADLELQLGHLQALESSIDEVVPTTSTLVWDNKMNFTGKVRRVKVIPLGQAATESDAVLYLEVDSLLFASDLLVVDRHPTMQTSNIAGWRAALDSLDLLPVREIIPGHGPITDTTAIDRTRDYLDMVEAVASQVSAGEITAESAIPSPPFDSLLRLDRFSDNLLTVIKSRSAEN